MAAPHNTANVPQDTPITIKVSVNDSLKKLKLPLKDLGANVLLDKVRPPSSKAASLTPSYHLHR
jgi:next to BRCA1 gene 1 protein